MLRESRLSKMMSIYNQFPERFIPPAHTSLLPRGVDYVRVERISWLSDALPQLNIATVQVAEGGTGGNTGNYRVESATGELFFIKIKHPDRASRERRAALISSDLKRLGVSTFSLLCEPVVLRGDEVVFVYPWVEHNFFRCNEASLSALGKAISDMHRGMMAWSVEDCVSIVELYRQNIYCLRDASFFEEADATFSEMMDFSAMCPPQIAHNDLHVGNVLFYENDVVAIIDFEDAVNVASYPLIDITAAIERFAFTSTDPERAVRTMLTSYFYGDIRMQGLSPEHVVAVGKARCYNALGILSRSQTSADLRWQKEWDKIYGLLKLWGNSRDMVLQAIRNLG